LLVVGLVLLQVCKTIQEINKIYKSEIFRLESLNTESHWEQTVLNKTHFEFLLKLSTNFQTWLKFDRATTNETLIKIYVPERVVQLTVLGKVTLKVMHNIALLPKMYLIALLFYGK